MMDTLRTCPHMTFTVERDKKTTMPFNLNYNAYIDTLKGLKIVNLNVVLAIRAAVHDIALLHPQLLSCASVNFLHLTVSKI